MNGPPLEWKATLLGVWEKSPGGNGVCVGGGGCIPWAWESPSMKAGDDKGAQAGVG